MRTPMEMGLPEKFYSDPARWAGQYEIMQNIAGSLIGGKDVFLLDAPTGVGKSVIGAGTAREMADAHVLDEVISRLRNEEIELPAFRCIYLTRTKQLQDQLVDDFYHKPGARTIKGRKNYVCLKYENNFPKITAEDCTAKRKGESQDGRGGECKFFDSCPYRLAKKDAVMSRLAVLNCSYFLAEANGPGWFSKSTLLICDEIDVLEGELMSHIQLTISNSQLDRFNVEPPKKKDQADVNKWVIWAANTGPLIEERAEKIEERLSDRPERYWSDIDIELHKQAAKMHAFVEKLKMFVSDVREDWIFYEEEDQHHDIRWVFKPVIVSPYMDKYFSRHAKKVLGMSGTILDPGMMAGDLGLPSYGYKRMDCPFPLKNRPIYYRPVANLTRATMETELPKTLAEASAIIDHHAGDKILVHATSYAIRDYMMQNLPQKARLITHDSENRNEKLEEFKASSDPLVMVSPSFDRGVDLPDDLCRAVIICKVAYPSMGDPQVKARMEMPGGNKWYLLRTMQTVMQMTGRGVRSMSDFCSSYILDHQFSRLLGQTSAWVPGWWRQAIIHD
ncbi:MAG: ATP-dependent DNA helicase [Dehalococcoidales bacterium]|nr:ATP-dependent DNA helicase [Dehalococcoidales bacterium]